MEREKNPLGNQSTESSKLGSKDARSGSYALPSKTSQRETFKTLTVMTDRVNKFQANPFLVTDKNTGKSEMGGDIDEMSSVISESSVEYDGFERLAIKYVIKTRAKKVLRYPEIKSRSTTPNKKPNAIEEELISPQKSPDEDPFATKLENESDTDSSDGENEEEDPDTWTVIVYKGVVNKGKPAVEDRRFVMFSDSPRMYIRVEELEERLLGDYETRYRNDWKLENKGRKPFTVWKVNGSHKRVAIPSLTFKKGVAEQYAYWKEVAKAASRTKSNYDPASRYWDLSGPNPITRLDIELRFEASDKVSQEELEVIIPVALNQCRCRPKWEAVKLGEGTTSSKNEKGPWVLVGKHLLGLYSLYASPKTIEKLKNPGYRLWLDDRHFPDGDQAAKADKLLFPEVDPKTPRVPAKETGASVSPFKLQAVGGQPRVLTQAAVMNNKSATLLAQRFGWPANAYDDTWKNQAEWLHRCAFSYGGLGESANHLTSQTPDNLIFGTKEANTLMMRAEATVKHLVWLEDQALRTWLPNARTDKVTATIKTKFGYNYHEEGDKPFQQDHVDENFKLNITERSSTIIKSVLKKEPEAPTQPDGVSKPGNATENEGAKKEEVKVPAWMKEKKYRWFAPRLVYAVQVSLSGRDYNNTLEIIPFARRIPMRLEFELDKLAEELVFGTRDEADDQGNMPRRERSKSRKHGSLGTAGQ